PNSGAGGDTITAVSGGIATANLLLARGDLVNLTGGTGNATVNALAGNDTVTLGSGAATVFGASGDSIGLGNSAAFVDAQVGGMAIQVGASGSDTIYAQQGSSGAGGDTITAVVGGNANANIILAKGDRVDLSGGLGNATINALTGNDTVTLGSGRATVFGAAGDVINTGAALAFVNATLGNMSVVLGSSGSDTIFSGTGDSITGAAGGTASATVIGAANSTINL